MNNLNHKKEKQRKYMKEWRKENKEHIKKSMKIYREINKEKIKQWQKEYNKRPETIQRIKKYYKKVRVKKRMNEQSKIYRKANPEKVKAHIKALKLIPIPSGTLCEICQEALAVDRHHEDYNKPLDVKFLCRNCHSGLHTEEKNGDR